MEKDFSLFLMFVKKLTSIVINSIVIMFFGEAHGLKEPFCKDHAEFLVVGGVFRANPSYEHRTWAL